MKLIFLTLMLPDKFNEIGDPIGYGVVKNGGDWALNPHQIVYVEDRDGGTDTQRTYIELVNGASHFVAESVRGIHNKIAESA